MPQLRVIIEGIQTCGIALHIRHMWRPDPSGTETSLRRIYAGQKYPYAYTLSISTGKNQRRSTMVIYIPTEKYKYIVITESDTILQEYYVTWKYKVQYRRDIQNKSWEVLTIQQEGLGSQTGEELRGRATTTSKLLLHPDHHGRIRCAFWSATARSPSSRL